MQIQEGKEKHQRAEPVFGFDDPTLSFYLFPQAVHAVPDQ